MKGSASRSKRTRASGARHQADAPLGLQVDESGDDFVLILSQLTDDIERFDSMISSQRRRLEEHRARVAAADRQQIGRRRKRIKAGAARIVTRAQGALEQLRGMTGVPELHVVEGLGRGSNRRAEDQPA